MINDVSVRFSELTLGYRGKPALTNISGCLHRGSLTAVTGPNGSGKSTLLKGIAGILQPLSGRCAVSAGERTAWLPQIAELDRHFPANVRDLVSLGLWPGRGLLRRHRREDRQRVSAALVTVGLGGFENRPLGELSGGQFQRALFARVIVQDASLILLDEPFNAVDSATTRDMLALIDAWHQQRRTVAVVVHDPDLVSRHFPQRLHLNGNNAAEALS